MKTSLFFYILSFCPWEAKRDRIGQRMTREWCMLAINVSITYQSNTIRCRLFLFSSFFLFWFRFCIREGFTDENGRKLSPPPPADFIFLIVWLKILSKFHLVNLLSFDGAVRTQRLASTLYLRGLSSLYQDPCVCSAHFCPPRKNIMACDDNK